MTTKNPDKPSQLPSRKTAPQHLPHSRKWQAFTTALILYCLSLFGMVALVIFLSVLEPEFLNVLDSWGDP